MKQERAHKEEVQMKPKECNHFEQTKQQYSKANMKHRWRCEKCGKWFLEVYKIAGVYEIDKDDKFKILRRLY